MNKIDLSLDRIRQAAQLLQLKTPPFMFHVTGTNGKGSTCAFLVQLLMTFNPIDSRPFNLQSIFILVIKDENHLRIGSFNSPHFMHPSDSIKINHQNISKEIYDFYYNSISELSVKVTNFEKEVLIAFSIFQQYKCQLIVCEVGMGGLYDATNLFTSNEEIFQLEELKKQLEHADCYERPKDEKFGQFKNAKTMTLLTSIGKDHLEFLGPDMKHLIFYKLGIWHTGTLLLYNTIDSEFIEDFYSVFQLHSEMGEKYWKRISNLDQVEQTKEGYYNCKVHLENGLDIAISPKRILGRHQLQNASLALNAFFYFCQNYLPNILDLKSFKKKFDSDLIKEIERKIEETEWHGRLELLTLPETDQKLLLDGAHNSQSAKALSDFILESNLFPIDSNQTLTIFISHTRNRDFIEFLTFLFPIELLEKFRVIEIYCGAIGPVENMPWVLGRPIEELNHDCNLYFEKFDNLIQYKINGLDIGLIKETIETKNRTDLPVVVTGSLYFVSQVCQEIFIPK